MINTSIQNIFKNVTMFSSLEEKELIALERISQIYNYKENETLFIQGDVSNSLMLLIDGVVSVFKHDNKGNEIVIGYFNRYSLLAEAATLRHSPLPSSARFQTDGKLIKIDIKAFETLFMAHPNISYAIIQSLLEKVDLLQQNIHLNIASTSREKVLQFYKENPKLSLDLKQYEIATLLSMTAETFSRNLKKLVEEDKLMKIATGYTVV